MVYLTHLTILQQIVEKYPNNAVFKVPGKDGLGWRDICYKDFWDDITRLATCWLEKLDAKKRTSRDVIGLWMFGKSYVDVVHLYSLQRAGYVPHLMSSYVDDIDLVRNLFEQTGVKVIICDVEAVKGWQQLSKQFEIIPFSSLTELASNDETSHSASILPPPDGNGDDILSIEQSSGSSTGRPKFVQFSRRWVDANAQKCQIDEHRTPVFIRSGSFCYVGQLLHALRVFLYADCMVLTPKIFWPAEELAGIISECGVTDIALYPSLINDIIQKARDSPILTEKLRSLRTLTYGGGPLNERAIEWAKENSIPIVARFASTEIGMIMVSQPGTPHLLQFYRKFDYEFVPIPRDVNPALDSTDISKIRELVVLPTSPDCPPPDLRQADGIYYSKDLFEQVESSNGKETYIFRGRRDDIIIMEEASNCDAKYLEDRIAYLCHDLISTFVVVGQGRPSPAVLVEPKTQIQCEGSASTEFHKLLSARLEPLISSRGTYDHERLKPEYIIVLPKGSLPVSSLKGTVMRSKAEGMFKELLDRVYAGDSVWNEPEDQSTNMSKIIA